MLFFLGGSMCKESTCNAADAWDVGSIPGLERSPGGGHGNSLQFSCLENLIDRGTQWATIHRVAKSRTSPKRLNTNTLLKILLQNVLWVEYNIRMKESQNAMSREQLYSRWDWACSGYYGHRPNSISNCKQENSSPKILNYLILLMNFEK